MVFAAKQRASVAPTGRVVRQSHICMAEDTGMIDPPLPIIGSIFCRRNKGALAFRANTRP